MNSSAASSEVLERYQTQYQAGIASGEFEPFVWPHRAIGPYFLISYLLLPPTFSRASHLLRYPLFILIVYLSAISNLECRSPAVTVGYGIGLLNGWTVLWSATLLIFNNARTDWKRIERQETATANDTDVSFAPEDVTPVKTIEGETTALEGTSSAGLTLLHPVGEIAPLPPSSTADSSTPKPDSLEIFASQDDPIPATLPQTFVWQPLPSIFLHRADWVLDLACNFRGLRWAHQLPTGTFPPPSHISDTLHDPDPLLPSSAQVLSPHPTRTQLLKSSLRFFILNALLLDAGKYIASKDPYFLSSPPVSSPSPFPYPHITRLLLSVFLTYSSLLNIFLLSPLVLSCICGPRLLGPHASAWLYPPFFGPLSHIPRSGLAGLWGRTWHQAFRLAFQHAGDFFAGRALGLGKRTPAGQAGRLVVAFTCSGLLHASASYTIPGPTRPARSFAFFALQPLGIVMQRALSLYLRRERYREAIPPWMRGVGNVAFVLLWCAATGALIADEFAGGGVWLYEPLPVSIFKGWNGEGWWRWGGEWVRFHRGRRWWKSGLVFFGG